VDLAVGQNGSSTKLFRNTSAKSGLRVKLKGPAGNSSGVGAVVRLKFEEEWGPAREIHAGSGYWSQDSPETLLAAPKAPDAIEVSWPGGRRTRQAVQGSAVQVVFTP
jgi:hypothetical protein